MYREEHGDVYKRQYQAGKQPEPQPGVHNSGWARDPGDLYYKGDTAVILPILESYVKDILTTFKDCLLYTSDMWLPLLFVAMERISFSRERNMPI